MPREISPDTDKAFLKGEIFTVEDIKKRFSLAVTINNSEIMEILIKADHPLTTKEIGEKLKIKTTTGALNEKMRKLFKENLVVRFYFAGNRLGYLVSEKGRRDYQMASKIDKTKTK